MRPNTPSATGNAEPFQLAHARGIIFAVAMCAALLGAHAAVAPKTPQGTAHLALLDVFVDSGAQRLAAYQFELATEKGDVKILRIEGGEHPAFREPPYYDPAAIKTNRVAVAAFSTSKDLPKGKTRVARIRVQVAGSIEPEYVIRLEAAGTSDGHRIKASVSLAKGEAR